MKIKVVKITGFELIIENTNFTSKPVKFSFFLIFTVYKLKKKSQKFLTLYILMKISNNNTCLHIFFKQYTQITLNKNYV